MNREASVNVRWTVLLLLAAALLFAGAGAAYILQRSGGPSRAGAERTERAPAPQVEPRADSNRPTAPGARLPDVAMTLAQDAIDRAGIAVARVATSSTTGALRLPGVVEPNGYAQVVVTPLVGGRVTRVLAELGAHVRRGQTLAQVFSPELAEAYTRYTAARAELDAHERELRRTEQLVDIGAASRQELERIHAEHTVRSAEVQSARSRLELLGVGADTLDRSTGLQVSASADVRAPIDGVVTERVANVGQNVESSSKLFTVVDLSTVWVVADLYETDFGRVHVGSPATVTTVAYPDLAIEAPVSYIDPEVSAQTRTARLRVEVKNARSALRLGMYADVEIAGVAGGALPVIPRSAVQTIGDHQVVYLVDPRQPGRFIQREVHLGRATADAVEVMSGIRPGDSIVTAGSFFLRAEHERAGTR